MLSVRSTLNVDGDRADEIVQEITAEIHLIAIDSDLFFTAAEDQRTLQLAKSINENVFYHELSSIHGHDAFLIENDAVIQILDPTF